MSAPDPTHVPSFDAAARRALLALWALPGLGPRRIDALVALHRTDLGDLLSRTPDGVLAELPKSAALRARLANLPVLDRVADTVLARARDGGMSIAYRGDAAYPARLTEVGDAPPLLFHLGRPGAPRPRVAMVGSRLPDGGFAARTRRWAQRVAEAGVGVVSGGAEGIDWASHLGALDAGGETWAFVGSALDRLDARRERLAEEVLRGGGVVFSELPPGVPASKSTFPRRNRLISGASDAVWVLRASARSGTLHTAAAALAQGRALLAMPGDADNPASAGGEALLASGRARRCGSDEDVLAALGLEAPARLPVQAGEDEGRLSPGARVAYRHLGRAPVALDALLARAGLETRALVSALTELELNGLAVQHPGRTYERI